MGPRCPRCGHVHEWSCGELDEAVYAPKIYFCEACRNLFILAPAEVTRLQDQIRALADWDGSDELPEDFEIELELEPRPDLDLLGRADRLDDWDPRWN